MTLASEDWSDVIGSIPAIDPNKQLAEIEAQLKAGGSPPSVSIRTFLGWFGTYRRGYYKVRSIREALARFGLKTVPDFESAYIDAAMSFAIASAPDSTGIASLPFEPGGSATADGSIAAAEAHATDSLIGGATADPTYRIGKLAAANNSPVGVKPGSTLAEAVTLMLSHDFSQIPVMQSSHTVKGVVTWTTVGSRLALKRDGSHVEDFMEPATEINADCSLFAAITTIVGRQYALIRDAKNQISGIVTTSDLSLQFGQLGEPFLLLGQIENHIRRLIDGKFTSEEVRKACDPSDAGRTVESVSDLTFGEYVQLLANQERWGKLALAVDRTVFVAQLDQVRAIRNDVMHFDPDGVTEKELAVLRRFDQFLATLQKLGAT